MTQEQTYQVVAEHGDVELRRYAPCVLAEVVVSGSAERAGNTAFRPLLSYISGRNRSRVTLDMTSPVLQSNEKLAMTAAASALAVATTARWLLPGRDPDTGDADALALAEATTNADPTSVPPPVGYRGILTRLTALLGLFTRLRPEM